MRSVEPLNRPLDSGLLLTFLINDPRRAGGLMTNTPIS